MSSTPSLPPTSTTPSQQQFCVRWNSYQSNLQNAFPKLLTSEHFVDVTLACENDLVKCHKVVLSACSTYFEKLLVQNPCQHPIIFMKDMKFAELQALVDFMYKGEVNVTQDELPSLLRSAEALQIRGLCGSDQLLNSHYLSQNNTEKLNGPSNPEKKPDTNGLDIKPPVENGRLDIKHESTSGNTTPNQQAESNSMHQSPYYEDDSYFDQDGEEGDMSHDATGAQDADDLDMDTEFLEQDEEEPSNASTSAVGNLNVKTEYAMANVSCQYNEGQQAQRRIRRSEAELRSAAECITRGQTFQTVSDQFNIPISTIRFYMARKGILPRRKRGRACSAPGPVLSPQVGIMSSGNTTPGSGMGHGTPLATSSPASSGGFGAPGNTSPVGPPYHIVHYKLPALGAKLK